MSKMQKEEEDDGVKVKLGEANYDKWRIQTEINTRS